VCFLGDDTVGRDDVTAKGRQALVEITRWIREKRPAAQLRKGHRDYMQTSCPGNELYNYIHSDVFAAQLAVDEKATLRKQVLAWRASGWGWEQIKATQTWKRFRALGGK
jgi:lipoate synthase